MSCFCGPIQESQRWSLASRIACAETRNNKQDRPTHLKQVPDVLIGSWRECTVYIEELQRKKTKQRIVSEPINLEPHRCSLLTGGFLKILSSPRMQTLNIGKKNLDLQGKNPSKSLLCHRLSNLMEFVAAHFCKCGIWYVSIMSTTNYIQSSQGDVYWTYRAQRRGCAPSRSRTRIGSVGFSAIKSE